MSAIAYQSLPSETSTPQTAQPATSNRSWRQWRLFNKPQEELFVNLAKLMGVQIAGFVVAEVLNGLSPEPQVFPHIETTYTYKYYTTCGQVANAFLVAGLSTALCSVYALGYFLKMNKEQRDTDITPAMKIAIANEVEQAVQMHLQERGRS